jgi:DNA repair protein RadC
VIKLDLQKKTTKRRRRRIYETPVYKVALVEEGTVTVPKKRIGSPEEAVHIIREFLRGVDREHFVGLYLDSSNQLICIHPVSVGTLNASLVHPREVFKLACIVSAASVIVAHNHPSGNTEPSREDISVTKQLVEAGKILDIPVHDHLIVTPQNGYVSFAERGLI